MAITPAHDVVNTSPTNVFPTFSPIHLSTESTPDIATLSDGNLVATVSSSTCAFSNFQIPKTGKWFIEVLLATDASPQFGIGNVNAVGQGSPTGYYGIYNNGSSIILYNGSYTIPASSGAWSPDDVNEVGLIAIDSDNNKIWLGVNANASAGASSGLYIGNSTSAAFDDNYPTIGTNGYNTAFDINDGWFINVAGGGSSVWVLNCGQDPTFGGRRTGGNPSSGDGSIGLFHTVPPTGFKALCTANLPDPAIDPATDDLPEDFFKAVTWQGNGTTNTQIDTDGVGTGTGFKPDLIWYKNRDYGHDHGISDSVRGPNFRLYPSYPNSDISSPNTIQSFEPNGFKIGSENGINNSAYNYIGWAWKAGGAPSGATSATGSAKRINTSGTQDDTSCSALASAATSAGASNVITPTLMSINQKSGVSIIKATSDYTSPYSNAVSTFNNSVPHGLSIAPEFVIAKNLDDTQPWVVFHKHSQTSSQLADGKSALVLNTSAALYTNGSGRTLEANDKVIRIGHDVVESTGEKFICYAWHSVEGYSAFGSYVGNGSADGPFVYTGFKPAWIMIKRTDVANGWEIHDNARDPHNPSGDYLVANESSSSFGTTSEIDFLSNGFKIRTNVNSTNNSVGNYIFACFAEMPFKFSATNAR